jgi:drug/metabolite transporter (DMT)-like permease
MKTRDKGGRAMILATGCFTINDALCKWLMPQYAVGEIVAVRSLSALVLIGAAALLSRPVLAQLVFKDYKLHAIRAGLLALSAMLFLSGLSSMPLTNALSLSFASPLFVVLLARPLLGERVAGRCWVAVAIGFIGMLLVLEPSVEEFGWQSVFPACAAMVSAATDLMTSRMSNQESSFSLVASGAVGAFVFGLCTAIFGWHYADSMSLGVMVLAGAFMVLSYYFIVEAFRRGPASYVAPFRYSALIWAVVIAFLAWGQTPNPNVLFGAAVLMASGWYLAKVPPEATITKRPHL